MCHGAERRRRRRREGVGVGIWKQRMLLAVKAGLMQTTANHTVIRACIHVVSLYVFPDLYSQLLLWRCSVFTLKSTLNSVKTHFF